LRKKYAAAPSQFLNVDGVPIHIRDEGQGPVLLFLHGSIANLHQWDGVATRLTNEYRVVRLDWPPYGLSGPDPSGVYSTARAAQLVAGVVEALKLDRVILVATSNGVNVALEYNAHHAAQVRAMALSIVPLERPSQTRAVAWQIRAMQAFHRTLLPDYHFHSWFRWILQDTTAAGFQPTQAMTDMFYDMNNLPGAATRQKQYIDSNTQLFKTRDLGSEEAREVRVPVLLQWCSQDTVISQSLRDTLRRFVNAPVELVTYADVGHFPMWEAPERFTADLRRFAAQIAQAQPVLATGSSRGPGI
jgi:pimeloyl-ACP methyl ester carboxylesterase